MYWAACGRENAIATASMVMTPCDRICCKLSSRPWDRVLSRITNLRNPLTKEMRALADAMPHASACLRAGCKRHDVERKTPAACARARNRYGHPGGGCYFLADRVKL